MYNIVWDSLWYVIIIDTLAFVAIKFGNSRGHLGEGERKRRRLLSFSKQAQKHQKAPHLRS